MGPDADPAMAILDNRLPYMDRETLCKEHGYSSCIKWLPARSKFRVDENGKKFNGIRPDPNDVHGECRGAQFRQVCLWPVARGVAP